MTVPNIITNLFANSLYLKVQIEIQGFSIDVIDQTRVK